MTAGGTTTARNNHIQASAAAQPPDQTLSDDCTEEMLLCEQSQKQHTQVPTQISLAYSCDLFQYAAWRA